jgi:broad specificity phosphatase PhoE
MTKDEALLFVIDVLENHVEDPRSENLIEKTIKLCKKALEQPAQEPVAWMFKSHEGETSDEWNEYYPSMNVTELYTHLHQVVPTSTWQGLTDDEIDSAWSGITKYGISGVDFTIRFARAIEQALRNKNG